MAAIVWFDFEGSVVQPGLSDALFAEFVPEVWDIIRAERDRGEMTREQANAAAMRAIEATDERLRAWTREHADVAAGLYDVTDWAHWHGWLPIVVSTAPDLVVNTVLDDMGLDRVTRHCGRAVFEYRWKLTYYSPRGIEIEERFAVGYASSFQRAGDVVAYVGSKVADVEAARLAQVIFARGPLLEVLGGPGTRVREWSSLRDVRDTLDREAEAWLASSWPAAAAED